ncbi:hypothetical protein WJX81_006760, partial [Elliptochloris bilobata]
NFSWDFVYSEYLMSGNAQFRSMVWQIAEDYACADLLLRLPGHCPMPAFREVVDVPLVVRHSRKTREQVFGDLGLHPEQKLCCFLYGGQPPGRWALRAECLPPGWTCVVCAGGDRPGDAPLPPNFLLAPADAYTPDLIAASTCMIGKIGYGSVSECLCAGTPMVFLRRDYFNEEPFLRRLLQLHGRGVEIRRRDFLEGTWAPFLLQAATLRFCYPGPTNGGEVVAQRLEEVAATRQATPPAEPLPSKGGAVAGDENGAGKPARAGSVRLRDAIVWGYMMHRHNERDKVEVPDWYTRGLPPSAVPQPSALARDLAELSQRSASSAEPGVRMPSPCGTPRGPPLQLEHWRLLEGGEALPVCRDSVEFLHTLALLDEPRPPDGAAPSAEVPELRAARGLFRWDDDVIVTRAPGRLDVMGGIADYSGALVLQQPLAEACHVAVQRHPLGKQRLWRHMEARQRKGGPQPALRVVSFGADRANRGPAFDMDLPELLAADGGPIAYADARAYFHADPAHSWAAYVAGALVVLMREKGATFPDGLSVLVHSAVPEGKGVSSSAAVEVAVMQALAVAHGIALTGRELAMLCQKVENHVVGAPCGVMDQMASALGEAGSLMALRCQPAEPLPPVALPPHLRLWGIDSGIRHSVGGLDFGTVRAAAFMGLRIMSGAAAKLAAQGSLCAPAKGRAPADEPHNPVPLGGGYLANVAPSEFAQLYEDALPAALTGCDFTAEYGRHWDAATQVREGTSYPVRRATAHPIHEDCRVRHFHRLLTSGPAPDAGEQLALLGELMFQSHASYGRCGLGSEGTDRLVALVRAEAAAARAALAEPPLYGAKITGGGSGGTVVVLGRAGPEGEAALARVVAAYAEGTGGYSAQVFSGSSPGAARFGHLRLQRSAPPPPRPSSDASLSSMASM